MSNTRPVETSIHAVSPLSSLGASLAAAAAFGSSATTRLLVNKLKKQTATKGMSKRFTAIPSGCDWRQARTDIGERSVHGCMLDGKCCAGKRRFLRGL